jgi:HEAT repeat protein
MSSDSSRRLVLMLCGLMAVFMSGCADLDFLPAWFPFQGPVSDMLPNVVTPRQRIAKLREEADLAASKSPAERKTVSDRLVAEIQKENDPLIRREIVRTLGKYPGPAADAIMKAALNDPDSQVRIAACESWGRPNDAEAIKLLAEALHSDVEFDVRMAAARALGETRNIAAKDALGEALADNDPAMQYQAVLSLKKATGKDLGEDIDAWQRYVRGEPEPTPSLADKFRRMF